MQFKKLFFSSTGAILVSGTVGIYMAYTGFGVWALVGQQISNQLLITLILWFTVKWRHRLLFSVGRVKSLFAFGWKILAASLIDTVYRNVAAVSVKITPFSYGLYLSLDAWPGIIPAVCIKS